MLHCYAEVSNKPSAGLFLKLTLPHVSGKIFFVWLGFCFFFMCLLNLFVFKKTCYFCFVTRSISRSASTLSAVESF